MLVIRKPREAEIKTLAALEHVCFPEEEAASSQVMRARYEAFPDNFLVAESDGVIRGYINGCSSTPAPSPTTCIMTARCTIPAAPG